MMTYLRKGFILSSASILLRDIKINNKTCNNLTGVSTNNLLEMQLNDDLFINIREEPFIFINNISYVLRDKNKPLQNLKIFKDISNINIEITENKLKEEIINEYQENKKLKIHIEDDNGVIKSDFILVEDVMTSKEFFAKKHSIRNYKRIPLSSYGGGIQNGSIDNIIQLLRENKDKQIYIMSGRNYSRFLMVYFIYEMLLKAQIYCLRRYELNETALKEKLSTINLDDNKNIQNLLYKNILIGNFRLVHNLTYILENKKSLSLINSILDSVEYENDFRYKMLTLGLSDVDFECNREYLLILIERYITLILIAEYILNYEENNKILFKEYISFRYEYSNLFKYIENNRNRETLLYPLQKIAKRDFNYNIKISENLFMIAIKHHEKKIAKIQENKIIIVTHPDCVENNENNIFINLIEEPSIYIKNDLFVLRDIEKYHKNVTFLRTLKRKKLEEIENAFKIYFMKELQNNGKINVYEISNGSLVSYNLIDIKNNEILTKNEFCKFKCKDILYLKIPITSSLPFRFQLFDKILKIVKHYNLQENYKMKIYVQSHTRFGRAAYFSIILDAILSLSSVEHWSPEEPRIECFILLLKLLDNGFKSYTKAYVLFKKYFNESFCEFLDGEKELKKIRRTLKKFFIIICFISYRMQENYDLNFENWMIQRHDILNLYNKIDDYTVSDIENNKLELDLQIMERKGEILSSRMILKNDYFVGSKFFTLYDDIKGVQNFRYVSFEDNYIFGLSIPTKKGIENTIKKIKAMVTGTIKIYWFCLREEPVIYVNKNPYVLRNLLKQNENIEITGITTEKIEEIEEKLKKDVQSSDEIILHDEIEDKNQVKTHALKVSVKKVQTMKDVYNNFNINYVRIPITDEKIPLPITIDRLYTCIKQINDQKILLFNCQMGKGRTTTGMIIAYLIYNHKNIVGKHYEPEFKIIAMLLQILPNSKESKSITDSVIDTMDHLENLREVIKKYNTENTIQKGKWFLCRYFYLICFGAFLLDGEDNSFVEFLRKRPEIENLAKEIDIIGLEGI